jgi:putative Mn2+ efflux pump MntP
LEALISCLIIGGLTFAICFAGILIGRKAGTKLANKAGILGGIILIAIGLEIFITGII